jgi:hypothetical protein
MIVRMMLIIKPRRIQPRAWFRGSCDSVMKHERLGKRVNKGVEWWEQVGMDEDQEKEIGMSEREDGDDAGEFLGCLGQVRHLSVGPLGGGDCQKLRHTCYSGSMIRSGRSRGFIYYLNWIYEEPNSGIF